MKKQNKKGFTIVELVIVIAVIGILAAVLIPTFSNVITNANKSAVLQEVNAAYKEAYAKAMADGKIDGTEISDGVSVPVGNVTYIFKFSVDTNGVMTGCTVKKGADGTESTIDTYSVTYVNGKWTVN